MSCSEIVLRKKRLQDNHRLSS